MEGIRTKRREVEITDYSSITRPPREEKRVDKKMLEIAEEGRRKHQD